MANRVTGVAKEDRNGISPAAGLEPIREPIQGRIGSLIDSSQSYLNRWFPPTKREALKQQVIKFASERPKLAAFLISQLILSGLPLTIFVFITITVIVSSLITGLLVGLIGALISIVFTVGFALCLLVPTLFFTTFGGFFVFLFGLGSYYLFKWFNDKSSPGVHAGLDESVAENSRLSDVPALNGHEDAQPSSSETALRVTSRRSKPRELVEHQTEDIVDENENEDHASHQKPPIGVETSQRHSPAGNTSDAGTAASSLGEAGGEHRKAFTGLGVAGV